MSETDDVTQAIALPIDAPALINELRTLPPAGRVDHLISLERAKEAVALLDPFTVYHLITEVGHTDAMDLIWMASDEQVQAFFDLTCWRKDTFLPARFAQWLGIMLESTDDDNVRRQLSAIDPEELALFLLEHCRVFVFDEVDKNGEGEPPPDLLALQMPWEDSPDNVYKIVYGEDEDATRLIRGLIKRLYAIDIRLGRALLDAGRSALPSNIEEAAYQVRCGRMESHGFLPFEEAAALYRAQRPFEVKARVLKALEPNPDEVGPDRPIPGAERFLLPDVYRETFADAGETFFARALARLEQRLSSGELERPFDRQAFQFRLVALSNKAMAADGAEGGDLEATRNVFRRVTGTIAIGLQYTSDTDLDRAAEILAATHPQHLFEAGHALMLGLQTQARKLLAGEHLAQTLTLTDSPLSLIPTDQRLLLDGILAIRPLYADLETGHTTPFMDIEQIHTTAVRVSLLAFKVMTVFGILKVKHAALAELAYANDVVPPVEMITLDTVLQTAIVHAALDHPADDAPRPLWPREVAAFIDGHLKAARVIIDALPEGKVSTRALAPLDETELGKKAIDALTTDDAAAAQALPIVRTTVRRLIESIVDGLGSIEGESLRDGSVPPHLLGDVLLVREVVEHGEEL